MNKRIRQLAQQAQVGSAEFGNGISYFVSTEEIFDKFAQLIVAECARVADATSVSGPPRGCTYGNVILEHFGVTE